MLGVLAAGAVVEVFQEVAGFGGAVFVGEDAGYAFGAAEVLRFVKELFEFAGDAEGRVVGALNGLGDLEAAHAAGVVGLVVGVGHDQHGTAGLETLRRCADAALVDYH